MKRQKYMAAAEGAEKQIKTKVLCVYVCVGEGGGVHRGVGEGYANATKRSTDSESVEKRGGNREGSAF